MNCCQERLSGMYYKLFVICSNFYNKPPLFATDANWIVSATSNEIQLLGIKSPYNPSVCQGILLFRWPVICNTLKLIVKLVVCEYFLN